MRPAQLGDTSLPAEQPEMLDDEFLQKLHHVLLEVRIAPTTAVHTPVLTPAPHPSRPSPTKTFLRARGLTGTHRGGRDGLPKLQPRLPNLERDPEHGACSLSSSLFSRCERLSVDQ